MLKFLSIFFAILIVPAHAQQIEQVQTTISLMIPCNGLGGTDGGNQIVYLENYVNQLLPSTVYITRTTFWAESQWQYPTNKVDGNITIGIDPGKQYVQASGFPAIQKTTPTFLKTLAAWELYAGTNQSWHDFSPPVSYHPGTDVILIAPECGITIDGSSPPGMTNVVWMFFGVSFQSTTGDLSTFPMPTQTYTADNDSVNSGISPYSIRDLFPAQTGTQIRVHVSSGALPAPTPYRSQASHVSVGIQSSGPNTVATPVELTFNGSSGFNLTPGGELWSDWINFPATAGQNLLGIVSFTNPTNTWGYKNVSAYGNWNSSTDGWNQAVMPGAITFLANRTHAIDRVQQR